MKQFFFIFLFLISGCVFAQDNHSIYWIYGKNIGFSEEDNTIEKEGIVGVKNCYVRDVPSTSGKLVDSLQLGKKVTVKKLTASIQKIKGINMHWAEIQYRSGNETKKGYLWLGFLALDFKESEGLTFMMVLDRINVRKEEDYEKQEFVLAAKVLDKSNVLLDSKEIRKNIAESYYYRQELMGNFGLQNIQKLYRISFSGEACGIPTYFFYFGWTGTKLLLMPEKMAVGDAGVYYYSENFIFPNEPGGKQGFIYKVIEEAEEQESANDNEFVMLEKSWKETYSWDGEKAKLIKKSLLRQELVKQ